MEPGLIGLLGLVALLVFIAIGMPIAFAATIVGMSGIVLVAGTAPLLSLAGTLPYSLAANHALTVIPLYILMGHLAFVAGIGDNAFRVASLWLSGIRGGLSMAVVAACAMFGACSGSSTATAVIMGKICAPEMEKRGYDKGLIAGSIICPATIAVMIPPSILLVVYGIVTEQSVGKLLLAGFVPGILSAIVFMVLIYTMVRLKPTLAPPLPKATWKDRFTALPKLWGIALIALITMGGIYSGWTTPTEAGALAAFVALITALALRKLNWKNFSVGMVEAATSTSMILAILVGVLIFAVFMALTRLPYNFSEFMTALPLPPIGILIMILVMYIILGMFLDPLGMMMLTLPIIFPVIVKLGFDPIWFGIIVVKVCEIGLATPPVAMNLYIFSASRPEIPLTTAMRGSLPFIATEFASLALIVAFPDMILFLPRMM